MKESEGLAVDMPKADLIFKEIGFSCEANRLKVIKFEF